MKTLRLEFGKKVRKYRKLRGWSQEELAEKVGVATKTVSQWENGKSFLEHSNLLKLYDVLGVKEEDLFCTFINKKPKTLRDEINNIIDDLSEEKQKQLLEFLKTFIL